MELSPDQTQALNLIKEGKSVFFTGCAGTGKSYLLRHLKTVLPDRTTYYTAMTGIAAYGIGGTTLHSFAGIGLGTLPAHVLVGKIKNFPEACIRWIQCEVLVIDEISMCSNILFDKLEFIARKIRDNDLPFGGIQLILCGDFYQLPPVITSKDPDETDYCFTSENWNSCVPHFIELKTVFRQTDEKFVDILNQIRIGEVTDETVKILNTLKRPLETKDGIEPTRLYARNIDVDAENRRYLDQIDEEEFNFKSEDTARNRFAKESLQKNCIAPEILDLKVGAQVMLLKNEYGQVNGSRGVVTKINKGKTLKLSTVEVKFLNGSIANVAPMKWEHSDKFGNTEATRLQIPLKLAWAVTIHKSQGLSLDYVTVDLTKVFAEGMTYVALSRARTMEGLSITSFTKKKVFADPRITEFYKSYEINNNE